MHSEVRCKPAGRVKPVRWAAPIQKENGIASERPTLDPNYFVDGHRGASMVAAHLLRADNNLEACAVARITELIHLNWASTPLCEAFPEIGPDPARINKIGAALAEGAEALTGRAQRDLRDAGTQGVPHDALRDDPGGPVCSTITDGLWTLQYRGPDYAAELHNVRDDPGQ